MARQLWTSAGIVECAVSPTHGHLPEAGSFPVLSIPRWASSGPGTECGAVKVYVGIHSCPNSTSFLWERFVEHLWCAGPMPGTLEHRGTQCPWAHQLAGHKRKPYNA